MSEGRPLPLIEHRFVDRMKSPYTKETRGDLERRGFFFVVSKPIDTRIEKHFDELVHEYRNALADLMEGREPLSKVPPSKDAPLDLRTFILMWLKAGYEIRFVKSESSTTVDLFARFDLDRFLFRGESEESKSRITPETLLSERGYQKDGTYPLHHWGDYDVQVSPERRREYTIEALAIETCMRALIAQNYDVRLIERRQGDLSHITIYMQPRMPLESSGTEGEPRLSVMTTENPDHLKDQGFHFVKNFSDDGSIEDKKKGTPDRVLRAFITQYWSAAQELLEIGLPFNETAPVLNTLKDRILDFRRKGDDVRLIRGIYDEHTHTIDSGQNTYYALFSRFDIGIFFAPPALMSKELKDKGYLFKKNLPFHAWGDALTALPRIPENALHENAEIEKYIQVELSKGLQVRLLHGVYDTATKEMDPTEKGVACFYK